jgi:hypothetical protein
MQISIFGGQFTGLYLRRCLGKWDFFFHEVHSGYIVLVVVEMNGMTLFILMIVHTGFVLFNIYSETLVFPLRYFRVRCCRLQFILLPFCYTF